ncbi:hypothetical protein GGI12_000487 [Dipsacomyces acuminosporus]|nr:hypothetical protein GGI12_000487 [Dipsacomyces acuminosporus]
MALSYSITHAEYISQLSRHLVSVPPSKAESAKRASVAVVIRLVMPEGAGFPAFDAMNYADNKSPEALVQAIDVFLSKPEFKDARAQMLFIQRARYPGDPWSGHIGFPGGKREADDGSDLATVERETKEELGLDIANEQEFICLGELDNVKAYSFFNSHPLLVLNAYVYLQVCKDTSAMDISDEVDSIHWVDFGQILRAIEQPCRPFSPTYRAIPTDFASRAFPSYRSSKPLWYRIFRSVFGRLYYTVLPLGHTKECSEYRSSRRDKDAPSADSSNAEIAASVPRYDNVQFSSDTELYLWGVSLCIVSNLVDLSLPVEPKLLNTSYISVASPWPQMERYLWADVNFIVNTVHRFVWSPYRRKPWYIKVENGPNGRIVGNNTDFFLAYFRTYGAAFLFSCLWKTSLACIISRSCIRAIAKLLS